MCLNIWAKVIESLNGSGAEPTNIDKIFTVQVSMLL